MSWLFLKDPALQDCDCYEFGRGLSGTFDLDGLCQVLNINIVDMEALLFSCLLIKNKEDRNKETKRHQLSMNR